MERNKYIRYQLVQTWWDAFQLGQKFSGINIMDERVLLNEDLSAQRKRQITDSENKIVKKLDNGTVRKGKRPPLG